jgi:membrane-bound serine protease (ClpP class)
VFLLLTIGVQAILIELNSPGGWVAGFVGAVSLALALYGLGLLDVNWFGLIILAISFVLFILDIKAPTHGALTAAGVGTLIWGALVLFNSAGTPSFLRVSVPLVVVTSVLTAGTFAIAVNFAIRAQRAPIRTGRESIVGRFGYTRDKLDPKGQVQVGGETWMAELAPGQPPLEKGARVRILEIDGIRLVVEGVDREANGA